jgi:hypothetical protein
MNHKTLVPVADVNSDIAWLTVEQVQFRLNLTRSLAYEITNPDYGEIPSVRVGRRIYVSETALNNYIIDKLGEPDTDWSDIQFFTEKQVEKLIFFSRSYVYGLMKSGELRSLRFGSVIMVPAHWLDDFLQQRGYAPRISRQAHVADYQIE